MKKILNLLLLFGLGWNPSVCATGGAIIDFDTSVGSLQGENTGNVLFTEGYLDQAFGNAAKDFYFRGSITLDNAPITGEEAPDGTALWYRALFHINQIRSSFPLIDKYWNLIQSRAEDTPKKLEGTRAHSIISDVGEGVLEELAGKMGQVYFNTNIYFLTIPQTFDIKNVPEKLFNEEIDLETKINLRAYTAVGLTNPDPEQTPIGDAIIKRIFEWDPSMFFAGSFVPTFLKISGMLTDDSPWFLGDNTVVGADLGDLATEIPGFRIVQNKAVFTNLFYQMTSLRLLYVNNNFVPRNLNLEHESDIITSIFPSSISSSLAIFSKSSTGEPFNPLVKIVLDGFTKRSGQIIVSEAPATTIQLERARIGRDTILELFGGTILELGSDLDLPYFNFVFKDNIPVVIKSKSPNIHPKLRIIGPVQQTQDGNVFFYGQKPDAEASYVSAINHIILDANVTFVPQSVPAGILTSGENSVVLSKLLGLGSGSKESTPQTIVNAFPDPLVVQAGLHNSKSDAQTWLSGYGIPDTDIPVSTFFRPQDLWISGNVTFAGNNRNVNDPDHPVYIGQVSEQSISATKPLKTVVKFEKPESLFQTNIIAGNADITLPEHAVITNNIAVSGGTLRLKNAKFRSGRITLGGAYMGSSSGLVDDIPSGRSSNNPITPAPGSGDTAVSQVDTGSGGIEIYSAEDDGEDPAPIEGSGDPNTNEK